jgi:hypothetical protein
MVRIAPYWLTKAVDHVTVGSIARGVGMGKRQSRPWIVSHELWSLIEPLLPEAPPKQVEGRPRVPDRQALCGILFELHTGIQWEYLPQELGFGSGMTCWRGWRPGMKRLFGTSSTNCC